MKVDNPTRVAIYARVSTADQTVDLQLAELRKYAANHNWTITGEYVDVASGSGKHRPEFDRLMTDAQQRWFDVVIVWKLDRWARSTVAAMNALETLDRLKIRWIATTQGLDTDHNNPMARFFLVVMSAVAELEKSLINERVRAGIATAKSKGTRFGRPNRVIDRTRLVELRNSGLSWGVISNVLHIPKQTCVDAYKAATGGTK